MTVIVQKIKAIKQRGLCGLMMICLLTACQSHIVFKDNIDFEEGKWYQKNTPIFSFEIEDPSQPYHIYYNVRNTLAYQYSNLYLTRYLLDAQGKVLDTKLDELQLADAKTGKPLGSGLGDLYDHKFLVLKDFKFPSKGKYSFKIAQYMRQEPLKEILSVGISIEKSK